MHQEIEPAIHYWGTPVVLVSTLNQDGTTNIAPMSSAWWLGWSCMLGLDASSKTVENLQRERECVLNLASAANALAVNRLARTTGSAPPPLHKKLLGYRYVGDKARHADLATMPSVSVAPRRIEECPVHLEAEVISIRPFGAQDRRLSVPACAIELRIRKTHVNPSILSEPDRIDPERWKPLLMSFRRLFALGDELVPSRLARGDESLYAPWKSKGVRRMAGRVVGALAHRRYGVPEPVEPECGELSR